MKFQFFTISLSWNTFLNRYKILCSCESTWKVFWCTCTTWYMSNQESYLTFISNSIQLNKTNRCRQQTVHTYSFKSSQVDLLCIFTNNIVYCGCVFYRLPVLVQHTSLANLSRQNLYNQPDSQERHRSTQHKDENKNTTYNAV